MLIFYIRKIHRLGPGSNPQPWVQKASDKPATPPNRLSSRKLTYSFYPLVYHLSDGVGSKPTKFIATKGQMYACQLSAFEHTDHGFKIRGTLPNNGITLSS
ncbi:hypothetical protein TNCV_1605231 [Trichonephila clavipes]|nr:hypothetical protein TNCV_1605231 [Trichonephila clavipes]